VPIEPKDRAFLEAEMDKFFFTRGAERPQDFLPKE
jgi:Fe-S cluster biosynthesis and repair protein YggX